MDAMPRVELPKRKSRGIIAINSSSQFVAERHMDFLRTDPDVARLPPQKRQQLMNFVEHSNLAAQRERYAAYEQGCYRFAPVSAPLPPLFEVSLRTAQDCLCATAP